MLTKPCFARKNIDGAIPNLVLKSAQRATLYKQKKKLTLYRAFFFFKRSYDTNMHG